ncbi:hypothetical protein NEOKW01_0414 [Nematocida sp. AWRm80]|nr:hypothetical protein NEOKW01_0414 [Nematocida sp. AWRm80]
MKDDFLKKEFSMGEYIGRILPSSSDEYSRIKDIHVRLLSKHTEALSEEAFKNQDEIERSLRLLVSLQTECKRVIKELPELFLPIASTGPKEVSQDSQKEMKRELEKMSADLSLLGKHRTLKYKEEVKMTIDGELHNGVILLAEDILIVGLEGPDKLEYYNALLLKELECIFENNKLVLSLPPIRIEIHPTEEMSLKRLHGRIEKSIKKTTMKEPSLTHQTEEPAENSSDDTESDIDRAEYNEYLLKIGRSSHLDEFTTDELAKETEMQYRVEGNWSTALNTLYVLKKKDVFAAFDLFRAIEEESQMTKISQIIHKRDSLDTIIAKLSQTLSSCIKALQEIFNEPQVQGCISEYLEALHLHASKTFIKYLYQVHNASNIEDVLNKLRKAFVYKDYSFEYTVMLGNSARHAILKQEYAFNKLILQDFFLSMCDPVPEQQKNPIDTE